MNYFKLKKVLDKTIEDNEDLQIENERLLKQEVSLINLLKSKDNKLELITKYQESANKHFLIKKLLLKLLITSFLKNKAYKIDSLTYIFKIWKLSLKQHSNYKKFIIENDNFLILKHKQELFFSNVNQFDFKANKYAKKYIHNSISLLNKLFLNRYNTLINKICMAISFKAKSNINKIKLISVTNDIITRNLFFFKNKFFNMISCYYGKNEDYKKEFNKLKLFDKLKRIVSSKHFKVTKLYFKKLKGFVEIMNKYKMFLFKYNVLIVILTKPLKCLQRSFLDKLKEYDLNKINLITIYNTLIKFSALKRENNRLMLLKFNLCYLKWKVFGKTEKEKQLNSILFKYENIEKDFTLKSKQITDNYEDALETFSLKNKSLENIVLLKEKEIKDINIFYNNKIEEMKKQNRNLEEQ